MDGFRTWNERTSTSPSGRHLGHYKALLAYPDPDLPDDQLPVADRFYRVLTSITNAAIRAGHILNRWKAVVNVLIEKIPGVPRINKLRVIHLFEADLNLAFGIIWNRRLLWVNEKADNLGDEQGGCRGGRSSINIVFKKKLTYEIADYTKTDGGTFDNDAKACYDRIVINIAMLICRHFGLPEMGADFMAKFLEEAKYYLKTKMGINPEAYYNTTEHPLFGSGQGLKASPPIWALISVFIMKLMPHKSCGVSFSDPALTEEIHRVMDGYVDDTTVWVNHFLEQLQGIYESTPEATAASLQRSAQWWEELLHTTGGKLELDKCFYYLFHWKFDEEGEASLMTAEEMGNLVHIVESESGTRIAIKQRCVTEAHKTLGTMLTPTGDMTAEEERLTTKGKQFARNLRSCKLPRADAHLAYRAIYLQGMQYSLPVCTFTEEALDRIQSAPVQAILNSMGYNRNMPKAVRYGPIRKGGIGLRNLFVEQGAQQCTSLIKHARHKSQLGRMFVIMANWYQATVGISYSALIQPEPSLEHESGSWIPSLRKYLKESNCGVYIQGLRLPRVRRKGDVVLMDAALNRGYTKMTLQRVNRVRIFLQVECLSECVHCDGKELLPTLWNDNPSVESESTLLWPQQARPGPKSIEAWKMFMQEFTADQCYRLRQPLGKWYHTDDRRWPTYYDPISDTVALHSDTEWLHHIVRHKGRHTWQLHTESLHRQEISTKAVPVTRLSSYLITNPGCFLMRTPPPEIIHYDEPNFYQFIQQTTESWERDLLRDVRCCTNEINTLKSVLEDTEGKVTIVSDGGAIQPTHGSFGWVVEADGQILWEGKGRALGHPMTSFRAEGYGHLAVSCFVHRYAEYVGANIHGSCDITYYTDSKSLLKSEDKFQERLSGDPSLFMNAHQDVIIAIEDIRAKVPFMRQAHVKGHQDRNAEPELLSLPARLNIRADELATEALDEQRNHRPPTFIPLPQCRAYLLHDREFVCGGEPMILREFYSECELEKYQMAKHKWDVSTYVSINWEAFGKAIKSVTSAQRVFIIKYCHRWLPTCQRTKEYGQDMRELGHCHLCHEEDDDDHFLQCSFRRRWRAKFIIALNDHLKKEHTVESVRNDIITGTDDWLEGHHRPIQQMQDAIGWGKFLKGYVAVHWGALQQRHYDRHYPNSTKYTASNWTKRLILFIWKQMHELWRLRCQELFDKNSPTGGRNREEAIRRVKALYELQDKVSAYDRCIFGKPLQEKLKESTSQLTAWAQVMAPAIGQAMRDFKRLLATNTQDIRNFFRPEPG